jgi:hypothetical protein
MRCAGVADDFATEVSLASAETGRAKNRLFTTHATVSEFQGIAIIKPGEFWRRATS